MDSFFRQLERIEFNLCQNVIDFHNSVTKALNIKATSFQDASDKLISSLEELRKRADLGDESLSSAAITDFIQTIVSAYVDKVKVIAEEFEPAMRLAENKLKSTLDGLVALFHRLDSFCDLVHYTADSPKQAREVGQTFAAQMSAFHNLLSIQVKRPMHHVPRKWFRGGRLVNRA